MSRVRLLEQVRHEWKEDVNDKGINIRSLSNPQLLHDRGSPIRRVVGHEDLDGSFILVLTFWDIFLVMLGKKIEHAEKVMTISPGVGMESWPCLEVGRLQVISIRSSGLM